MQQRPSYDAMYASDEFGRPFIILKEQEKKSRVEGLEATKVCVIGSEINMREY